MDHRLLSGFAQDFAIESGEGKTAAAKYYGGELRKDKAGGSAHVAIGGSGASLSNAKETATFTVLQQAAGVGRSCTYGNINGAVGKAVNNAVGGTPFELTTVNAAYTDAGVFGVLISVDARQAGKVRIEFTSEANYS